MMIQINTLLPSEIQHHNESTVCVVDGGSAGVVLSYLLARRGISVTLLEAQSETKYTVAVGLRYI